MIAVLTVVIFLVAAGLFFFFAATVGFLRFPDFYSRMHATGKGDTFGVLLTLLGLSLYNLYENPSWYLGGVQSFKLMAIVGFWFLASPTATHPGSSAVVSGKAARVTRAIPTMYLASPLW